MLSILRIAAIFLLSLSVVLTGCTSTVKRPLSAATSYAWSFAKVNNDQARLVCKKITIEIYPERSRNTFSDSQIVEDGYCAKLAKPQVRDSANPG